MSIDEYFTAFDRLMGSLTSMVPSCTADECPAHKFIAKFLTYRFVMGVREDFDSICKWLLHDSSDLTMAKALSDLLAEETRLKSMSAAPISVCWQLLKSTTLLEAPLQSHVTIVERLLILQKIIFLRIRRSWLIFVHVRLQPHTCTG